MKDDTRGSWRRTMPCDFPRTGSQPESPTPATSGADDLAQVGRTCEADGEGREHRRKTRGFLGVRPKAAQNPAHLAHGTALRQTRTWSESWPLGPPWRTTRKGRFCPSWTRPSRKRGRQPMAGNGRRNADLTLARQLAAGRTVAEAAQSAGLSERMLYRRLEDVGFRRHVSVIQAEMASRATGRLSDESAKAVATLAALPPTPGAD
jgi:hypothetical protein